MLTRRAEAIGKAPSPTEVGLKMQQVCRLLPCFHLGSQRAVEHHMWQEERAGSPDPWPPARGLIAALQGRPKSFSL